MEDPGYHDNSSIKGNRIEVWMSGQWGGNDEVWLPPPRKHFHTYETEKQHLTTTHNK